MIAWIFERVPQPAADSGVVRRSRRARVPTILQMEAVECGAASLAMILAFFGRWVPLVELRTLCGVSRDGSKAGNIVKAARVFGLQARALKQEPAQLRSLPPPFIVHWNMNHFLVVEGFRGNKAYLADPATGPRTVSLAEFDAAFTGITLTFERGPEFTRGGVRRSVLRSLGSRLTGVAPALAYVVLAGVCLVVPGLVIPAFLRIFIDNILIGGITRWTGPLIMLMLLTALTTGALTWLQQRHLLKLEMKLALSTSAQFLWHVLRLPVNFFNQRSAGDLGNRVGINDRVAQLLSGQLANTGLSVLTVTFYVVLMFRYDVLLTLLAIATTSLNVVAVQYTARRRVHMNRRLMKDQGQLGSIAYGGLLSIEQLKAMGADSSFFARWGGFQAKVVDAQQKIRVQTEVLAGVPPFLNAISTVLLLGVGGHRIMAGEMTIGTLVAFQALVAAFHAPAQRLVDAGVTVQEIEGALDRVDDVIVSEIDPQTAPSTGPAPKLVGRVAFRGVTFGYGPLDPPLVRDFNLDIPSGARVALVGGSGSGKSTLARLVCGLYKPWNGEVLFDDVPRQQLSHERLSSSFSLVDQDIFLFEGTIRENICLWDPTVSEADLTRAAMDACIHDEIMSRPEGYDAKVDEGGRNFSGGQRQRLEIARALVTNPTILVLDEATSALDPVTEKLLDDRLRRRGCTCLIIAHRLSTIRDADEIIVLKQGDIEQRGRHDELKVLPGLYRDLVSLEAA